MSRVGYVVYGAGAIGGVVGGRLFEAGLEVTLIARGRHLDVLRASGLRVESPDRAVALEIPAVGHPREIDWRNQPVVLMAMKSQHTAAALADLAEVAPAGTPIVCLQNGIANEPAALRFFPHVYAVCVMCPAGHLEPGTVQAWSTPTTGMLDIGRFPADPMKPVMSVSADFAKATFSSNAVPDIARWKNRKLLDQSRQRGGGDLRTRSTERTSSGRAGRRGRSCAVRRGNAGGQPGRRPDPAGGSPPAGRDRRPDPAGRILVAERATGYREHRDGLPQR